MNSTHHKGDIKYVADQKLYKTYPELDNWFVTVSGSKEGMYRIYAPYTSKGYQPGVWGHMMGGIFQYTVREKDGPLMPPSFWYWTPSSKGVKSKRKVVNGWDLTDIDGAVRYLWLNTQKANKLDELRELGYSVDVITEAHYEQPLVVRAAKVTKNRKFRTYPEIENWMVVDKWAVADTDKYGYYKVIYAPSSTFKDGSYVAEMGIMKKGGGPWANFHKDRLTYFDKNGKTQSVDWDFNDEENAVRYVYMQSQIPEETSESLNEGRVKQDIEIEGLPGWRAQRYDETATGGNAWWSITNKGQYMGAVFDTGLLNVARNIHQPQEMRPELINNPIQTARYMYLMMQPKK